MGESIMNSKIIQDRLNEHGLVFRITDERLKQATYEKTNDVVGVLEVVSGGYLYDETGSRVLTMQVEFVGKNKDFNLFREIVNEHFPNKELVGDVWVYAQPLQFSEFPESEGFKKFNARIVFQVVEVVGGVSGRSTSIQVDGVEIDFTNVLYRQDKTLMPFKAFGVNKEVKLVNEIISIKLPMSDNTKNISLITEALDNSYNASHEIKWNIGGLIKTFDAVLRVGIVEYSKNHEPLLFTITFERALPREEWAVALFHKGNYWEVDNVYKPANVTYYEEITTETEFREYLETLEIEEVGTVVKNEYIEGKYWGSYGTIKHFKYMGLADGSEQHTLYMNSDDDPAVWLAIYENPNSYAINTTFRVVDVQYGGSYRYKVEEIGSGIPVDVYDGLDIVVATSEAQTTPSFAINRVTTLHNDITQQGYVMAIKVENREFEYVWWTDNPLGAYDDNFENEGINSPATFMHCLSNEMSPYGRPYGQRIGGTKDGTGRVYLAEVVAKNVWYFFKQEIDGFVYYGSLTDGGGYGLPFQVPVIDYAAKHSLQTTQRWKDNKIVGKPLYYANGFTVMFLLNETTRQFIDDLHEQKKNKYKITYTIGSKTYTYEDMLVSDIDRQNTENANQVMQVTFTEGE